ncbi:nicotinate-nucleotide diphosphorylase (carboxylating) [Methanofervidicoccus sp. A16]|uniref:carboxylating nicotinate-nucleotide diphosphorylase n=1 Tax=Methanofervidicoccus sp. A16 TaxID=2607662 RepID=UPI00118C7AB2|nr:carboxylating nicotinate-nucleotide diphosphorylase [Methanofervidicoccus sp. A16]AXI25651.1 nicotinate-nucleotide diphosphorylase (carboxylating) [Methanofervidicoccus sp. A16]
MLSLYAKKVLNESLINDVGYGDITTELIIPEDHKSRGEIVIKEDAVICGINFILDFLRDYNLKCDLLVREGKFVEKDSKVMEIEGNTRKILSLERTILNFLMHLSGIATKTYRVVKKVREVNKKVRIACTRKTLPLLSPLEKYAVVVGGGDSHRFRLDDMVMIKDNHIEALGVEECFKRVKKVSFTKKVEVEVDSIYLLEKVLPYKPDIVLLDNFKPKEIGEALEIIGSFRDKVGYKPLVEVSGGIREDNVLEYAKYDVDIISMGCLIHSAPAVDMSLNILK